MSILPERLDEVLGEEIYKREDSNLVQEALIRLGVEMHQILSKNFIYNMQDLFGKNMYPLNY